MKWRVSKKGLILVELRINQVWLPLSDLQWHRRHLGVWTQYLSHTQQVCFSTFSIIDDKFLEKNTPRHKTIWNWDANEIITEVCRYSAYSRLEKVKACCPHHMILLLYKHYFLRKSSARVNCSEPVSTLMSDN